MKKCMVVLAVLAGTFAWVAASARAADEVAPDLPVIKKDVKTGFCNAGWKYDRYKDLPSLDAGKSMVVADIKGPGIIRHIHTCRHQKPDLMARGIVIEIYFDDATEPAVCCPLADFFGDGCNGKSMYFSSRLIECAPWSYNCYFPMPFASRAKVVLRNDTAENTMNYSYVEWEPLGEWKKNLGYFHATYRRKAFQLTRDTKETFFHVRGTGHLLGRQFSVVTDEPLFNNFGFVMEGNNEVDIDGQERALDYLGTEDSFTFSWGFQTPYAGLRAGMTHIGKTGAANLLSIYRFHDHMPIRFAREFTWSINWRHEGMFTSNADWARRVKEGGCWVDYATVFYWYQDSPGGFQHDPLAPVAQRGKLLVRPGAESSALEALLKAGKVDDQLANTFAAGEDLARVQIAGAYKGTHPFWIDKPQEKGGHPGAENGPQRRRKWAAEAQRTQRDKREKETATQ